MHHSLYKETDHILVCLLMTVLIHFSVQWALSICSSQKQPVAVFSGKIDQINRFKPKLSLIFLTSKAGNTNDLVYNMRETSRSHFLVGI